MKICLKIDCRYNILTDIFNKKRRLIVVLSVFLMACTDNNDHFCAKYGYYYEQLEKPGLPPYSEMKAGIEEKIANGDESALMMKFVLNDFRRSNKPKNETPKAFCMRRQLWLKYGD